MDRCCLQGLKTQVLTQPASFHTSTPQQAALGGSPSRLGLVNAFLRVKEKDRGALDFDQPGGVDTTWQRIYCCLRAGFHAEAVQVGVCGRGGLEGGPNSSRP